VRVGEPVGPHGLEESCGCLCGVHRDGETTPQERRQGVHVLVVEDARERAFLEEEVVRLVLTGLERAPEVLSGQSCRVPKACPLRSPTGLGATADTLERREEDGVEAGGLNLGASGHELTEQHSGLEILEELDSFGDKPEFLQRRKPDLLSKVLLETGSHLLVFSELVVETGEKLTGLDTCLVKGQYLLTDELHLVVVEGDAPLLQLDGHLIGGLD